MVRKLDLSSLIPLGLAVTSVAEAGGAILIAATAMSASAACPLCKVASRRIHSRYARQVSDLPCAGRSVRLNLMARRFRCDHPLCRQKIFAERFDSEIVATRSRRTTRLDGLVHYLGIALGGRPDASLAKRLMLPVINDTLLRTVRRRCRRPEEALRVVGMTIGHSGGTTATAASSAISNGGGS